MYISFFRIIGVQYIVIYSAVSAAPRKFLALFILFFASVYVTCGLSQNNCRLLCPEETIFLSNYRVIGFFSSLVFQENNNFLIYCGLSLLIF